LGPRKPRHTPKPCTNTPDVTLPNNRLSQSFPFFLLSRTIGTRHYDVCFRVLRRSVRCGVITIYYEVCFFFDRTRATAGRCHACSCRLQTTTYPDNTKTA
jgi:hypothetical protein